MKYQKHSSRYFASSIALTIALAGAPQAFAQSNTDTTADNIDEIIVTARKRDETVLEIPVSVSAFSQDTIEKLGITDAASLSDFTPGFKFENEGTGGFSGRSSAQIRFRGVGVQASTPSSRAGAFFWDGAYISDGAGLIPLMDLERAEVIKGPQTAFFGRNTFSGAVNYIPAAPTDELSGKLIGELTTSKVDDGYDLTGIINVPINDRIRSRIAVQNKDEPGFYEYGDGTPLGEYKSTAIIGSVHFDVSDNFTLKYSGSYVEADDTAIQISQPGTVSAPDCDITYNGSTRNVATGESTGDFATNLSLTPFGNYQCGVVEDWDAIPFDVPATHIPVDALNVPGFTYAGGISGLQSPTPELGDFIDAPEGFGNTYQYWRHHLSADFELASGHTLSGLISNSKNQTMSIVDANFGTDGLYTAEGYAQISKDLSMEARLSSPGDNRLRYSLGATLYDQESVIVNYGQVDVTDQDGKNFGIFGSFDYDLTDAFTISAEGRWHDDEQIINYQGRPDGQQAGFTDPTAWYATGGAFNFGCFCVVPFLDANGQDPNAVTDQSQQYSAFMPRVILSYSPSDNLNIYGSWSESRLQGVPTGAVAYGAANPTSGINEDTVGLFTDIQEMTSFELGIKQNLGDRFSYSAAFFSMDWENQVFFQLNSAFQAVYLPGDSEYKGIEAEAQFDVTDDFKLYGGFNYVDAEFTDFGVAGTLAFRRLAPNIAAADQIDATGNQPRYIPALTGSFGVELDLSNFLGAQSFVRFDGIHTGDFFLDNLEFNEIKGYTKFNARLGIQLNENVGIEIFGNNLTDDRSWSTSGGTTGFFSRKTFGGPTKGREIGLKGSVEF